MIDNWHVFPHNDKLKHNTDSEVCICHPKIEIQSNGNKIIVHNSFDGREYKEKDNNLLVN